MTGSSCALFRRVYSVFLLLRQRTMRFDIFDWAVFKTALVALGTLVGIKFSKSLRPFAPLVAAVYFVSVVYTMLQLFCRREST